MSQFCEIFLISLGIHSQQGSIAAEAIGMGSQSQLSYHRILACWLHRVSLIAFCGSDNFVGCGRHCLKIKWFVTAGNAEGA